MTAVANGFLSLVLVVTLPLGQAWAHQRKPTRAMLLQWDSQGTAAVLQYKAVGKEAALYTLAHDLNRDGQMGPQEKRLMGLAALGKGVAGLRLKERAAPLKLDPLAASVRVVEATSERVEVHALWEWPRQRAEGVGQLEAHVAAGYGAVGLTLQALDQWRLIKGEAGALSGDGRGLAKPVHLHGGDTLKVDLKRIEGE